MIQPCLTYCPLTSSAGSSSIGVANVVNVVLWITFTSRIKSAFSPSRVALASLLARPVGHDLGVERGLADSPLLFGASQTFRRPEVVLHAPGHQGGGHCHEAKACCLKAV
jgi:hypothetical protein